MTNKELAQKLLDLLGGKDNVLGKRGVHDAPARDRQRRGQRRHGGH